MPRYHKLGKFPHKRHTACMYGPTRLPHAPLPRNVVSKQNCVFLGKYAHANLQFAYFLRNAHTQIHRMLYFSRNNHTRIARNS